MSPKTSPTTIQALHADDLRSFLDTAGLADDYDTGVLRCVVCSSPVIANGIGAARGCGDDMRFACSRPSCMREFA